MFAADPLAARRMSSFLQDISYPDVARFTAVPSGAAGVAIAWLEQASRRRVDTLYRTVQLETDRYRRIYGTACTVPCCDRVARACFASHCAIFQRGGFAEVDLADAQRLLVMMIY